jgi:sporulation protein YlmC with PRC-barrel domain
MSIISASVAALACSQPGVKMMSNRLVIAAALTAAIVGTAYGQQSSTTGAATPVQAQVLSSLPANSVTVANYYKQNVYDPSDAKIGEISDVLMSKDGKVDAFIISVGGFLGIGNKDVAVPFSAVHATEKNGTWYLSMNATKDALKQARGYTYDKARATWVPAA